MTDDELLKLLEIRRDLQEIELDNAEYVLPVFDHKNNELIETGEKAKPVN